MRARCAAPAPAAPTGPSDEQPTGLLQPTKHALTAVRTARHQHRPRVTAAITVLAVALVASVCWSLTSGSFPVPMSHLPAVLLGYGAPEPTFIVNQVRLPRLVCGVLVGLAFGISGAMFQSLVDNELASPDIIGITAGSSAAAVLMIVVLGSSATLLSAGALAGGLVTAAAIYTLSYRRGITGFRLILVGIGFGALLSALTSYLFLRADREELSRANIWLTGSLNGRGWEQVTPLAVVLVLLVPAAVVLRRALRALQLGDDAAHGIGVPVTSAKAAVLAVGVALAAFATAAAGPVAFVAFVSAPVARRLLGNGDPGLVAAGLFGALLVTFADALARVGVAGIELPVGILTGILGAPYLVWLLIRTNRSTSGG